MIVQGIAVVQKLAAEIKELEAEKATLSAPNLVLCREDNVDYTGMRGVQRYYPYKGVAFSLLLQKAISTRLLEIEQRLKELNQITVVY
jgi:hypothetical protein